MKKPTNNDKNVQTEPVSYMPVPLAVEQEPVAVMPAPCPASDALVKALQALRNAKHMAGQRVDGYPMASRGGWDTKIQQAKANLPKLTEAVSKTCIPSRLVGCFAAGPGAEQEASKLLAKGVVWLQADMFYKKVAEILWPAIGPEKVFGVGQYCRFREMFDDLVEDLGLDEIFLPDYTQCRVKDIPALVSVVRNLILKAKGYGVIKAYLTTEIINSICQNNLTAEQIPVIVTGATEEEQKLLNDLFSTSTKQTFTN